jgi:tocopherol cyclase
VYSFYKIFHPAVFQGSLKMDNYFEGWYFKHVSAGSEEAFAVIPGIALSADSHAFIQFIDSVSGRSAYFRYPLKEFKSDKRRFVVRIGDSIFSSEGIGLDLRQNDLRINGKIDYYDNVLLRPTFLRPGIMGWYSYIPDMECKHGVVSLNHFLGGSLYINGQMRKYSGGKGYIEKDWGNSFPESWIWLQCNNFSDEYISLMVSVAKIPWKGNYFTGFLGFIHIRGKTEIFATYNNSKIEFLKKVSSRRSEMLITKGRKKLMISVSGKGYASIKAPVNGQMTNRIKDSLSSEVNIEYTVNDNIIYSGNGTRAGYEEIEGIYKYFKPVYL